MRTGAGRAASTECCHVSLIKVHRADAAEAYRLGLVNRVVGNGGSLAAATELALEIAQNAHHGLAFMKEVVRTATDMEYNKALEYARDIRVISRLHPSFRRGLTTTSPGAG
jgi:enoyl-CoA hydratase/carnithine racemase